jgi:hypothetical protein
MAKWTSGESATSTEHKIEEFAEELGGLLGTARAKAEGWLGQRQEIVKHLSEIRDTATKLLSDLGHAQQVVHRGRRGRPPGSQNTTARVVNKSRGLAASAGRKKRTMSAEARARISAAQKARWAKRKADGALFVRVGRNSHPGLVKMITV